MLLLHTLARLTFSEQEIKPLMAGFLLHFAVCEGHKPRLNHCVHCGRRLEAEEPLLFDIQQGGLCCTACHELLLTQEEPRLPRSRGRTPIAAAQVRWMRTMLQKGASGWVNTPECYAPYTLLKEFVSQRMEETPRR